MNDQTTKIIKMIDYIDDSYETAMFNSPEEQRQYQASMLCKHARAMCMMYEATGDRKYLWRARVDVRNAKSILRSGFMRPLGVLLLESA